MSSITPPASDLGVQSLQHDNKTHTNTKATFRIAAKRGIHPSADAAIENNLSIQRRHVVRRSDERR